MEKLSSGAGRALRQAYLYGYLIKRNGQFYYPGCQHVLCTRTVVAPLLDYRFLETRGERWEITRDGRRAAMDFV